MADLELNWALDVILWFQAWRVPIAEALGTVLHYLGSEDFYLIILPFIYWCVDAAFGRRLAVLFMLSSWNNSWFKAWFKRPRPFMVSDRVHPVVMETGYGLPSGHSQGTTTLWGAVALQARKRWVTIAVAVYIVLMILSRMSLGVHFPQDVGLGFVLGLAWLGLYAWIEPKASTWLQKRKLRDQIGLVIAATLVMILVYPGLIRVSSPEWLETSVPIDDLLAGPLTPIAAFMGLGIGFALETKYVGFVAGGNWWKRLLRFAVGIIGVLILRFGLSALFDALSEAIIAWEPLFEGASRFLFRIIRYGLIGLWAGFAAPWAFVKAKLAEGKRA